MEFQRKSNDSFQYLERKSNDSFDYEYLNYKEDTKPQVEKEKDGFRMSIVKIEDVSKKDDDIVFNEVASDSSNFTY